MTQWKIIGRGKAGWHADAGTVERTETSSQQVSSSGGTLEKYAAEAVEGCLVYDADGVDYETFARHVISGPMVDVDLPAKHYHKLFGDVILECSTKRTDYSSLDHVSLDLFEEILRNMGGVKFGRVVNGEVIWTS